MLNKKILLEMNIQEILKKYPSLIEILKKHGMHCNECFFSEKVNLREALESSRLSSEEIVEEIIKYMEKGC
ncbi:DUF1858 domain-containing protein [uncultured Ilyobacter sp.]|uniref:DUF1858 domain-containing protein n=1 Tax=uncultured Ilyobacter sp. TaxID=544433 RepID=UPI0029F4591D|nr:DUF1858 domain-containing protein [uncultured Ilyobacter sp.]